MSFLFAIWLAWLFDLLVGDPVWLYHPVRLIGTFCNKAESWCRRHIASEKTAGIVTSFLVMLVTGLGIVFFFIVLGMISEIAQFCGSVFVLYTCVAARDLVKHSNAVFKALENADSNPKVFMDLARTRVGMIVGRDTSSLDQDSIVKACVESVSESMSDGVVAPLFWAFVGAAMSGNNHWAPLFAAGGAILYKAANTMDSMFGYKNQKYFYFGWFSAIFDDLLNLVPARLSGVSLVISSFFTGFGSGRRAWKIMRRDSRVHKSPNAGYPEAAMAGALGVELGGDSYYFGKLVKKAVIGDNNHAIRPDCIRQSNVLMLTGSFMSLFILSLIYYIFFVS